MENKLREQIAKTACQYAYLIADKDIDNCWARLTGKERWFDCADQILKLIKVKLPRLAGEGRQDTNKAIADLEAHNLSGLFSYRQVYLVGANALLAKIKAVLNEGE